MKTILLYTDTPIAGGAEIQTFLLAKFLDKSQFTPILACSNFPQLDRWCENFEKEGIKIIRLKVKHKHDPRHYFQLKKIIKEEKIDLVHLQVWNPASCRYGFWATKHCKIPLVITEHDPFKLGKTKTIIKKSLLKSVSKIIAISHDNAKTLAKLYPEHTGKITTIHNGIDITWWQSQFLRFTTEDRRKIKEELFRAHENTLIILCIAELHERKGQKHLIEAISKLTKEYPNVKLVFVGEGQERHNLEKLTKRLTLTNHIVFTGRQKEIPKLLKSSDIFVLPSRREAFGLVLLEAMISGLPVIASRIGGIPEIIEDEINGILFEAQNSDELAQDLIKLIDDPEKRKKIASSGQKTVLEKFTAQKMAENYEKIYFTKICQH